MAERDEKKDEKKLVPISVKQHQKIKPYFRETELNDLEDEYDEKAQEQLENIEKTMEVERRKRPFVYRRGSDRRGHSVLERGFH